MKTPRPILDIIRVITCFEMLVALQGQRIRRDLARRFAREGTTPVVKAPMSSNEAGMSQIVHASLTVNTAIHRHWPVQGMLSITHVDSEKSPLVQLADFVAGSVYEWHKSGNPTIRLIESKVRAAVVDDWPQIKARWTHAE